MVRNVRPDELAKRVMEKAVQAAVKEVLEKHAPLVAAAQEREGVPVQVPKVGTTWFNKPKVDWPGRWKVPKLLLQALLAGKGMDLPTTKARHDLLIRDAIIASGMPAPTPGVRGPSSLAMETNLNAAVESWPASKWSTRWERTSSVYLACQRAVTKAGYFPAKSDNSLSCMVKLILAGKQTTDVEFSPMSIGQGIHRITFHRAGLMAYRNEMYSVYWDKPYPALGSAVAKQRGETTRIGLFQVLKGSVGSKGDREEVRRLARDAERPHVEARAGAMFKSRIAQQKVKQAEQTAAALDAIFEMDAENPEG